MKNVSKGFFVGSLAASPVIGIVFGILGNDELNAGLVFDGLSLLFIFYAVMVQTMLFYKMWAAIQDGKASITPGKAIGFLFIPIFNLYWAYQAIWGYAENFNEYIQRHEVKTRQLPEGLFLTFTILVCIVTILVCIATQLDSGQTVVYVDHSPEYNLIDTFFGIIALILPCIFYLIGLYFTGLVMVAKICDGINAIAFRSSLERVSQPYI